MKPLFWIVCTLSAAAVLGASAAEGTTAAAPFRMRAVAHRGLHGPGLAQNSVASFKAAWARGAKWIETDFWELKCGRILCVHDRGELKRISGVDRAIADLTEAVVAAIDIGKFAKTPSPVHMPYLEDVLATVPKDCVAQCEIKLYGPTYADKFDAARRAAGLSETNIFVTSFTLSALRDFKKRYPAYRTGWLGAGLNRKAGKQLSVPEIIAQAKDARVDVVCPGAARAMGALAPADADQIRAAGFDFRLYGVNTPEQLAYALKMKATAFTCDHWVDAFTWAKALPGLELVP